MNDSSRKFETLLNSVEAIIWEADFKTSQISFVSQHAVSLLGYSVEKWMADPTLFASICHPEDLSKVQRAKDSVTRENNHYEVIYRMRRADGQYIWLSDRVNVDFDGLEPKFMRGISYDVSERRRIEEALALVVEVIAEASELERIDDISLHCISRICQLANWQIGQAWYPTQDEGALRCSEVAFYSSLPANVFRHDSLASELKLGEGLPGKAATENTPVFIDNVAVEKRSLATLSTIQSGFAFPVRNGQKLLAVFEFFGVRRGAPDKYFLNAIEEIGTHLSVVFERRQAQDLLGLQRAHEQVILDSMPSMVWYKDLNNRITRVNKAVCDTLGVSASDLEGKSIEELYPEESEQYFLADLEVIQSGKPKLGIVEIVRRGDGTIRWLHTDKMPYRDENGVIQGVIAFCSDVTQLKSAEDELKAAQADLEHKVIERTKELNEANIYFNLSHDLFCIASEDGYFKRINSAWSDKLGYSVEELMAKPYREFIHPDDLQQSDLKHSELLAGISVVNFENRYVCKDGSICWLLWSATPARNGLMYGVAYDITDRKAAEIELLDINVAMKNAVEGIAKIDVDDRYLSVNKSYADLYGYAMEELILSSVQDCIYVEDHSKWKRCYTTMLETGKAEAELLGQRKDGVLFHQLLTMVRVTDLKDKFTGYYVFNKDISARKEVEASLQQSEARFNQLASHVPGGIYQYVHRRDGSFYFPYVSESCRNILEVEPDAMMADPALVFSRIHPEDLPSMWQTIADAYVGPSVFEWEGRLITKLGGIKWIRCSSSPEVLDNGDVIFNGLVTDINEKKQADEEIRKLNLDLQERVDRLASVNQELETLTRKLEIAYDSALEASQLKSEFVANISHEIRTPISAVIGMSELLLDTVLDSQQKQFTTMVKDSAQSLLTIINDILDFSKIEAGRVELDNVDFSILSLIEDCAELLAPAARKKNLALLTWVDPRLPATLRGDPVRIRQVLLNLASNAVKFTKQGEVFLRAELAEADDSLEVLASAQEQTGDPGVRVKFTVTDSGIGLSQSARKRLFRPFVQADGSTTRKYGGTGLGLSISKLLVEMMSGAIDFVSEAGVGSSFWFAIPVAKVQDTTSIKTFLTPGLKLTSRLPDRQSGANSRMSNSVILVSSSAVVNEIVASYLSIYDIELTTVSALEQIDKALSPSASVQFPQLVIYDMAFGQELTSPINATDNQDSASRKIISGSFSPIPSLRELERFQSFCQAVSEACKNSMPALMVLGVSELPTSTLISKAIADSSYVSHMQKPFRLFEFLTELEKSLSGGCELQSGSIELPSRPSDAIVSPTPKLTSKTVASGQRILIAEDNAVMQELALRQVQRLGLEADLVSNGKEALAASRSTSYSLILMDCQMPEMDGYEATLLIRQEEAARGGHIPIIAMTASAMKGDRENCIAAGMDDYLSKPVGQEQLYRLLEKWLPDTVHPTKIDSELSVTKVMEEIPINCEELAALYGLQDLKRLISSFSAECEDLLSCIRQAVATNNDLETIRLAHQLKGLAVVMTADSLSRSALALESSAKDGDTAQLPLLTEKLEQELATVLAYIESRKGSPIFS
jgi:PAS domain S-box-containing protein